jgi:hypothetical protein
LVAQALVAQAFQPVKKRGSSHSLERLCHWLILDTVPGAPDLPISIKPPAAPDKVAYQRGYATAELYNIIGGLHW